VTLQLMDARLLLGLTGFRFCWPLDWAGVSTSVSGFAVGQLQLECSSARRACRCWSSRGSGVTEDGLADRPGWGAGPVCLGRCRPQLALTAHHSA